MPTNPVVGVQPTAVAPSERSWLGVARELTAGTAVLPTNTIPMDPKSFSPEDTPKFLPDEAIRGQMALLYNEILGPADATFSFGGPNFLDTYGYFLDNIFGDLSSGYNGTFSGGTVATTAGPAVGATVATVASAVTPGWTAGSYIQFEPTGSSISEVVKVTGTTATNVYFANNPLRFAHGLGGSIYTVGTAPTATFTHVFALLNQTLGYAGLPGAQPPTHTLTDNTNLITGTAQTYGPANPFGARQYPMACVSALDFTGNAEQLIDIKVTGNSWPSVVPSTVPTNVVSNTIPVAAWKSAVYLGGTAAANQVFNVGEWTVNLKRELHVYFTAQNAQTPFIIARGPFSAAGSTMFSVASDDTDLYLMIENIQPQMQITVSNGLSGTSAVTLTFNAQVTAFVKDKISRNSVLIGYDASYDCVANSTNVGGSGGLAPISVTLVNGIATY
jgi:hypothetical protein